MIFLRYVKKTTNFAAENLRSLIEIIYRLDVGDYTYTDNSGVVTLTQYTGIGGPVDTPEVEEI